MGLLSVQKVTNYEVFKISSDDQVLFVDPSDYQEILIEGSLGMSRVQVTAEGIHVEEAPCNNQICVYRGVIRKSSEWIACLPNRILISVEGRRQYDAITQ